MSKSVGMCMSRENALDFFQHFPEQLPEKLQKQSYPDYSCALNRVRYEFGLLDPVPPKILKMRCGKEFYCGKCGHGIAIWDNFCPNCGKAIAWANPRCTTEGQEC